MSGTIRVGVGGWIYEPWRGAFYPAGWPHKRELEYASRHLTTLEINATFYRTQSPASFARWRDETPDGFVFSVKAPRYATQRKALAEAGESIGWFIDSGVGELRSKLGAILWQLAPTKRFDAGDVEAFLKLLPREIGNEAARHAVEVRHASFMTEAYVELARRYRVATVFTDSADYPSFADRTADFVYARLMRAQADQQHGYAESALDEWATCARAWSRGAEPHGLPYVAAGSRLLAASGPGDVFVYFIDGAKQKAPAAALALIDRLK